jgi:hypothetical protein
MTRGHLKEKREQVASKGNGGNDFGAGREILVLFVVCSLWRGLEFRRLLGSFDSVWRKYAPNSAQDDRLGIGVAANFQKDL